MKLLLLVAMLVACSSAALAPPQQCKKNCEIPRNTSLSYCKDKAIYPSCILDIYENSAAADLQAQNRSDILDAAGFATDPSCENARREFVCALFFPKCEPSNITTPQLQFPCHSTCENFFLACKIQQVIRDETTDEDRDLCEPYGPPGDRVGPSDTCTGGAEFTTPFVAALLVVALALL